MIFQIVSSIFLFTVAAMGLEATPGAELRKPPPGPFDPSKLPPGFKIQQPGIGHGAPMPPPPTMQAMSELFRKFKEVEDRMNVAEAKLSEIQRQQTQQSSFKPVEGAEKEVNVEELKETVELLQLQNNNLNSRIANLEAYVYELRKETGLLASKTKDFQDTCDAEKCQQVGSSGPSHTEKPDAKNLSEKQAAWPVVSVYRKSSYTETDTVIPYDELIVGSTEGLFDLTEGSFTAPAAGRYSVGFYARNFDASDTFVQIRANGRVIGDVRQTIDSSFGMTIIVDLQEGDIVDTFLSSGGIFSNANRFVYFTVHGLNMN